VLTEIQQSGLLIAAAAGRRRDGRDPSDAAGVDRQRGEGPGLMMTPGEHMNVVEMRRAGWSISAIAKALGRDRNTIAKWIELGGPPPRRVATETVVDEHWAGRVAQLLEAAPTLPVTSLHRLLGAEGCPASYPTLTRHVRAVHGPRRVRAGSATAAIETPAGEEAQADWSELSAEQRSWLGLEPPVYCFGAILCWSRQRHWWFADSLDFHHTIEGFVRSFDALGGVPAKVRIDNMGCLVTRSHPKLALRPPATAFVNYYGFSVAGCWPKDAARKGKVERPFRELKESFLAEMRLDPPGSIAILNQRAVQWLDRVVHARVHRVTKERPVDRWTRERSLLASLPHLPFDTARRVSRQVPATCLVEVDAGYYSVPPTLRGQTVEVRVPTVADKSLGSVEIRHRGVLVVTHPRVAAGQSSWHPAHRAAVEHVAMNRHRRRLHVVGDDVVAPASTSMRLDLPGDFEVADIDIAARLGIIEEQP